MSGAGSIESRGYLPGRLYMLGSNTMIGTSRMLAPLQCSPGPAPHEKGAAAPEGYSGIHSARWSSAGKPLYKYRGKEYNRFCHTFRVLYFICRFL